MCGRTACTLDTGDACKACEYKDSAGKRRSVTWHSLETGDGRAYCPSYNVAPTDVVPCIVSGTHFDSEEERVLCPMIWGMIPRWHKGDPKRHGMSTHNARYEGLLSSKMYAPALKLGQRCVIICDGYYEWKTTDKTSKGSKQPYFIYAKQRDSVKIEDPTTWSDDCSSEDSWAGIKLLKMAGIFDVWTSPEGKKIYSCSMITMNANDVLSWLHHRVPAFLDDEEEVAEWLDTENVSVKDAIAKLHGPTKGALCWHPVDPMVNNSRCKSVDCYKPIEIGVKKEVPRSGLMSSWLKTGTMMPSKRKSMDADETEESPKKKIKTE